MLRKDVGRPASVSSESKSFLEHALEQKIGTYLQNLLRLTFDTALNLCSLTKVLKQTASLSFNFYFFSNYSCTGATTTSVILDFFKYLTSLVKAISLTNEIHKRINNV